MPHDKGDTEKSRVANRKTRRSFFLASMLLAAVAASLLILKFAPAPFFWLWLTWAAAMFAAVPLVRGSWPRAILLDLGIVTCMLAVAEAYLVQHEYLGPVISSGFYVKDDVLGWAPRKGMLVHAFKANAGGLFHHSAGTLFDVTYTINSNGLRVAPQWSKNDLAGTALFFGCSYTFGEGLRDSETLPYQVGLLSEGRYRTINFAFEAYSPAQMLAGLEHDRVQQLVDTPPTYAFYVAAPIHVWRVAGRTSWGRHAPRYVLTEDGTVRQAGYYDTKSLDEKLGFGYDSRIMGQLDKSALWRTLSNRDFRVTDDDIRLYLAVVRRSQELLTAQYPGIQFHIILWPNQNAPQQRYVYEKMRTGFLQMGYPVHLVEAILPDYWSHDRSRYILGPGDHHPNALADRLLAKFVLSVMQQRAQAAR
jgi:hypothetical protein